MKLLHRFRVIGMFAFLCSMFVASGCKGMLPTDVKWSEMPGTEVPQVKKAMNYYPTLDQCQSFSLFAGKPAVTIMVVDGLDLSGKRDYNNGFYISQGFAGYVMDPIKRTAPHIRLIDGTRMARDVIAWMKQNATNSENEPQIPWQAPPGVEYILIIEVPALDFSKGTIAEAEVFKAGGGVRTYGGLVSVIARLVHRSGAIVAISDVQKDVPGVSAYLKTSGVIEKMMVHAHLEAGEHEAFQNALRALSHIAEYDLFAQFYGDRQCDKNAKGTEKDAKSLFDGETLPQGVPPYKQYLYPVYKQPAVPQPTPQSASTAPQCPIGINDIVIEAILYEGHNNVTFDPSNNAVQKESVRRIVALWEKGCVVKSIEGARCPKPPQLGVVLERAFKPAEYLQKGGIPKIVATEMPAEKLAVLHRTCMKEKGCNEDTYPWFYAAYVTIVHPDHKP